MKSIPVIIAIILLLAGIALMVGDFAFEADLPDWTARVCIAIGIVLSITSMMLSRPKKSS